VWAVLAVDDEQYLTGIIVTPDTAAVCLHLLSIRVGRQDYQTLDPA
jgi:hypothetical protein